MNMGELIEAMDLPSDARVDQRVPKAMLQEHAPTAADRRRIREDLEEVRWVAALKPTTIGVAAFRDGTREYLEIAILSAALRDSARAARIGELIHRTIPYPVVLVTEHGSNLSFSVAHKRWSRGEAGETVLDGEMVAVEISERDRGPLVDAFRAALPLGRHPSAHLFAQYQRWIDAAVALLSARLTGTFAMPETPGRSAARVTALRECAGLDAEISRLRKAAARERQIARQVELNLELKRVERLRSAALEQLSSKTAK